MPTVAELVSDIKRHGFDDATDASLEFHINDAIWDIDSREQWPYLETTGDINTSAGTATLTMPTQFSKVLSLINTTTGTVLIPEAFDIIRKAYPNNLTQQGEPLRYYFIGNAIHMYPVPGATYAMKLAYIQWQTELTVASAETAILMPPRHHRIIVFKVLENLYAQEDDLEASAYWRQKFEDRFVQITFDMNMRQFDRPDRVYIQDYDDFYN